jgi:hypothetical protein
VLANSEAQGTSRGWETAGGIAKSALGTWAGGLSLSPLLSGLLGLLGRANTEAVTPTLTRYEAPPVQHFEGASSLNAMGGLTAVDYGAGGLPRVAPSASTKPTPQVTVQVQAIDSRSFLDHSDEIARAVRQAILNSHALNDVVNEI